MNYTTLQWECAEAVARVTLNRPHVHNAFDAVTISELLDVLERVRDDDGVRALVLTGRGKSFCAGADLEWMREIIRYSFEQNIEESLQLAELMHRLDTLPKPTVAAVNGAAIGGGTGLLTACDTAVAADSAKFGLSEVKLGLVPAAISPYVIRKIGESKAREYFLTGKRLDAVEALAIGLVNEVVPSDRLNVRVAEITQSFLSSGPEAIASCKELILTVPRMDSEEVKGYTARMIARLRVSEEGQEGMAAFFEKRAPSWAKK